MEPRVRESQFHVQNRGRRFRFVSFRRRGAKRRAAFGAWFCAIVRPRRDNPVQGRHRMRPILAAVLLCGASAFGRAQAEQSADPMAHGKAVTEAGDGAGCHPADPAKPFAGGKRIDTPFGGIYSPNLTPDRDTGIGSWSDDEFYRALRYGMDPDGSRYYPAFPYPNFTKLIRDDILAIRAYLATLTPVQNSPPPPQLRWPLNYRVVMRAWNFLFFRPGIFEPNQQKSAEWNRGGYLVTGASHFGACHTPKNMFGPDKRGRAFCGGLVQGWFAPRLHSAERRGPKSRSVDDLPQYLQDAPNGKSNADGLMAEVVVNSTSKMSDQDIRAIAVYLKDLPAGAPEPAVTPPPPREMTAGKAGYDPLFLARPQAHRPRAPRVYPPPPRHAQLPSHHTPNTL